MRAGADAFSMSAVAASGKLDARTNAASTRRSLRHGMRRRIRLVLGLGLYDRVAFGPRSLGERRRTRRDPRDALHDAARLRRTGASRRRSRRRSTAARRPSPRRSCRDRRRCARGRCPGGSGECRRSRAPRSNDMARATRWPSTYSRMRSTRKRSYTTARCVHRLASIFSEPTGATRASPTRARGLNLYESGDGLRSFDRAASTTKAPTIARPASPRGGPGTRARGPPSRPSAARVPSRRDSPSSRASPRARA